MPDRDSTNVKLNLMAAVAAGLLMAAGVAAAQEADAGEEEAPPKESVLSLVRKGGPVMVPLGICSVLGIAIAIERGISLRRSKVIPPGFIAGLRGTIAKTGQEPVEAGITYCEGAGGPVGNIFRAGILKLGRDDELIEKAIEDAGSREVEKLKRSLRPLSIIATLSPLLGLLGTVYGMIAAFQTATTVGMGKADVLAKGIYEALVTTAAGLTIAIPVLLAYQYLNSKVDSLVDEMDEMSMDFMNSCVKR